MQVPFNISCHNLSLFQGMVFCILHIDKNNICILLFMPDIFCKLLKNTAFTHTSLTGENFYQSFPNERLYTITINFSSD